MYIVHNATSRQKSIMKLYMLDNLAFNLELLIDVRMTQLGIMKYEHTSLAFLSEYLISNSKYINSKLASKILKISSLKIRYHCNNWRKTSIGLSTEILYHIKCIACCAMELSSATSDFGISLWPSRVLFCIKVAKLSYFCHSKIHYIATELWVLPKLLNLVT